MTERTVKFGWWKGQLEIVHHEVIFNLPSFQTVRVSLGPAVSEYTITGVLPPPTYPSPYPPPLPPVFAQGTQGGEVDLPAGSFIASCGRRDNVEAVGTITYKVP